MSVNVAPNRRLSSVSWVRRCIPGITYPGLVVRTTPSTTILVSWPGRGRRSVPIVPTYPSGLSNVQLHRRQLIRERCLRCLSLVNVRLAAITRLAARGVSSTATARLEAASPLLKYFRINSLGIFEFEQLRCHLLSDGELFFSRRFLFVLIAGTLP